MVPKEPLGVPVKPHFRKAADPDQDWYCHHKTQGPWAMYRNSVSPPYAYYPESSCVKKYIRPGEDHSRRVFTELVKQGAGVQDCTVLRSDGMRSTGDAGLQRATKHRYSQIMKRPPDFPGLRPHSAPVVSKEHWSQLPSPGRHSRWNPPSKKPDRPRNSSPFPGVASRPAGDPRKTGGKSVRGRRAGRAELSQPSHVTNPVEAAKLAKARMLSTRRHSVEAPPGARRPVSAPGPRGAVACTKFHRRGTLHQLSTSAGAATAAADVPAYSVPLPMSARAGRPQRAKGAANSMKRCSSAP